MKVPASKFLGPDKCTAVRNAMGVGTSLLLLEPKCLIWCDATFTKFWKNITPSIVIVFSSVAFSAPPSLDRFFFRNCQNKSCKVFQLAKCLRRVRNFNMRYRRLFWIAHAPIVSLESQLRRPPVFSSTLSLAGTTSDAPIKPL